MPVHNTEDLQATVGVPQGVNAKKLSALEGIVVDAYTEMKHDGRALMVYKGGHYERLAREAGHTCGKSRELRLSESRGFNEATNMVGDMREAYGARRLRTLFKG